MSGSLSNTETTSDSDSVIGLNVGGDLFYTLVSTLTSVPGSYFADCLGPDSKAKGLVSLRKEDENNGQPIIYFLDRNSSLFQYILEYLRTKELPWNLCDFSENPQLWRALYQEADFFQLKELKTILEEKMKPKATKSNKRELDPIIGLDCRGERTFYTYLSTLTGTPSSSYFAARFGPDSKFSPGHERIDVNGRTVYFIDRDPVLFEHVMSYLQTRSRPSGLPDFSEDPWLWRSLREEALFFGLDELSAILQVTHKCSPNARNTGVLYWLGTDKGKREYRNPCITRAVHVGGWVDEATDFSDEKAMASRPRSRAAFVQFRPGATLDDLNQFVPESHLLYCEHARRRRPVVVDLGSSLRLCLSHYSLRYDGCYGMHGDWNLEASTDGKHWDVLHAARDDNHLLKPGRQEVARLQEHLDQLNSNDEREDYLTDYLEIHHRHTWETNSATFHRYFRIIGASSPDEEDSCLHGVGLELFGDVCEL